MSEQMQKELLARLDALAQKMGVAGHALWEMYVRQSYVNGAEWLTGSIVAAVLFVVLLKKALKLDKELDDKFAADLKRYRAQTGPYHYERYPDVSSKGFFSVAGSFIPLVLSIWWLVFAVDYLANPSLQAFQAIVQAVK